MSLAQQILLQIILILINAFFAATEIAVISLNTTKLRKMADDGDKYAPRLLKMAENPSGFLSTIQIGITLAGFLGSAFAADNLAVYISPLFLEIGVPAGIANTLAVIIITLISLYTQHSASHYLIFLVYSFWVPQIRRSLSLGQRPPITVRQILWITALKLFLPLYLFFCPYNMVRMFTTVPIPLGFGFELVGWIIIQVVLWMESKA